MEAATVSIILRDLKPGDVTIVASDECNDRRKIYACIKRHGMLMNRKYHTVIDAEVGQILIWRVA